MKNKTLTVYLALFFGIFGAHRLYLKGWFDFGFWLHLLTTALGLIGFRRAFALGVDDGLSWILAPFLGISIFAACLAAIVYGLTQEPKWQQTYKGNGTSSAATVFGVVMALLLGATALMSAIAFAGQRYFEYAIKSA